jgi:ribosomal protein L21E
MSDDGWIFDEEARAWVSKDGTRVRRSLMMMDSAFQHGDKAMTSITHEFQDGQKKTVVVDAAAEAVIDDLKKQVRGLTGQLSAQDGKIGALEAKLAEKTNVGDAAIMDRIAQTKQAAGEALHAEYLRQHDASTPKGAHNARLRDAWKPGGSAA